MKYIILSESVLLYVVIICMCTFHSTQENRAIVLGIHLPDLRDDDVFPMNIIVQLFE